MPPPAEEFPIEEFEGVPDWNAVAWARIQAQEVQALPPHRLGSHLRAATLDSLTSMEAVLTREPEDMALTGAIAAEIERRRAFDA